MTSADQLRSTAGEAASDAHPVAVRDAVRDADGAPRHPIRPRRVRFDFSDTPLHWIPGDPQTTHTINVLHLLLPAGEKWFVDVYREALPFITDEQLRAEVKGFMGQEAIHSRSHQAVLDHLAAQGLDTTGFTKWIDRLFVRLLADKPLGIGLPGPRVQRQWVIDRLAIIAAVEHFTAVLGIWVVSADGLDEAGVDPVMLDLLRWHGAEEVEHRSVAFDFFEHVSGARWRRVLAMLVTAPILALLWAWGTAWFMAHDPTRPGRAHVLRYRKAARKGILPPARDLFGAVPRYLAPDHHPSQEGSTDVALAYLASSPAALAAAG